MSEAWPRWARALAAPLRARLEASPTLRRFLPNTGWILGERMLRMLVALVVGVWVARYLGPGPYGQIQFALACVAIFGPLATLGLERILVRDLVEQPQAAAELLGSAFLLKLAGGTVAGGLALAAIAVMRPGDALARSLVVAAAAMGVVQAADIIESWYQSQVRSHIAVTAIVIATLLTAALRVTLILVHAPLPAFAWSYFAETFLAGLALLLLYRADGGQLFRWRWSRTRARALLRNGWPLMLSSAMIMIYMRIDQVMLGQMSSPEELGAYSVAVRLVEAWYFLPLAIVASVYPSIVEARGVSEALFYERLQKLYGLMALLGYAVAVPACLLSGWVVSVLYGPAYAKAAPMLAVLVLSLVFTNLGVARSTFLTAMNWNKAYLFTVFLGAVANVVLNLALIPRYGGLGAAIASLVAYWLAAHGSCYLYRPLFRTGNMLTRALLMPRI